jgi:hypothetical protein
VAAAPVWLPAVASASCGLTPLGSALDGHHEHPVDEICLVANQPTEIRHAGRWRQAAPGTCFLFRRGEQHGYRNPPQAEPHLWLVHFTPDPALYAACPRLDSADPEDRVWHLDADQQAAYQGLFQRLQAELAGIDRPGAQAAAAGWLRLLLISAARWHDPDAALPHPPVADPALANLWEVINDHIDRAGDFAGALKRRVPNYDSLRHRFRRVHGCPPRDLLLRLRMDRARGMLLESDLPVSEIAQRLGYTRLSEFTRAFTARVGKPPTEFRRNPGA